MFVMHYISSVEDNCERNFINYHLSYTDASFNTILLINIG